MYFNKFYPHFKVHVLHFFLHFSRFYNPFLFYGFIRLFPYTFNPYFILFMSLRLHLHYCLKYFLVTLSSPINVQTTSAVFYYVELYRFQLELLLIRLISYYFVQLAILRNAFDRLKHVRNFKYREFKLGNAST